MEFESANPSIVRSVKQRDLLNAWLRAHGKRRTLPAIGDYQPDRIADELSDMMRFDVMLFDVERSGNDVRFLITQEGSRLATTYGNEHIDPASRTNRYLDDAIGPELYARVVSCYRACLARKRPGYSICMVQDTDGKDVCYERLLLPFGNAGNVEQIVGSYKAISIEGGFKLTNLMGIRPKAIPVHVVRAIIDLDFVPDAAGHRASDDVVELG
jgi:hypothetical protein